MDSHCETMWADNPGAGLGRHPTAYYGAEAYDSANQALIFQQRPRSKMPSLWINNSLTTDTKQNLRTYKTSYAYNIQYYGSEMFFVIVKMDHPNTHNG